MPTITLTLHTAPAVPLEAPSIRPDRLAGLGEREIAALRLWHGNRDVELGEFFFIEVRGGADEVRVVGDLRRVRKLGAEMTGGRLAVEGDAGMHTGARMSGGVLRVEGSVDDWAGAEMTGGVLEVLGDAGDHVAGAYAGSRSGMNRGVVLVHGSAGAQAGARLRRGTVAVRGDVGEGAAAWMVAGTLLVGGRAGPRTGWGMKRGSVVVGGGAHIPPTFRYACTYRPDWLPVYLRELGERHGFRMDALGPQLWRRSVGDFAELGKGEILTRADA